MKRSYGLSEWQIGLRHVLRNAWLPFISMLGPIAATLLTGSFAIETIFAIPGLGKHFISAVSNRDYTLVMGITILYSVVLVVLNMLTDLCYGWLDPRIRVETSE
jgi:oligopeptide transport system permease protein